MDLLKTILVYMSMVVVASVQNAPDPGSVPAYDEPTPTPYVQAAPTPTSTPSTRARPRSTPRRTRNTRRSIFRPLRGRPFFLLRCAFLRP